MRMGVLPSVQSTASTQLHMTDVVQYILKVPGNANAASLLSSNFPLPLPSLLFFFTSPLASQEVCLSFNSTDKAVRLAAPAWARRNLDMDSSTGNPSNLAQFDSTFPTPSHHIAQQPYEPYGIDLEIDSTWQMQGLDRQMTPRQSYISHPFDSSPAIQTYEYNDAESAAYAQAVPLTSIGPPTRTRKRKAPTLRAEDWEPHKARIIDLH